MTHEEEKTLARGDTTGVPESSRTASQHEAMHTPGPWFVFDDEIVAEHSDTHVADVALMDGFNPTEWQANMRLIAAAPELLDAARLAVDAIEQTRDEFGLKLAAEKASLALRAAIAKAEGPV